MYEEYMQNLLGMQMNPFRNTYEQMGNNSGCCMEMDTSSQYGYMPNSSFMMNNSEDLEDMYPEIYRIVYPMVRKACMQNTRPVTRELVDQMTQDIYSNIEADNVVNLNIHIDNSTNSRGDTQEKTEAENVKVENRQAENRQVENRQFNRGLRDLIRILLLRELLR